MDFEVPDYQLFSSLRFDRSLLHSPENTALSGDPSPFYMLPFHRDRILEAARHFQWADAATRIEGPNGLQYLRHGLESMIDMNSPTPLRIRILLDYKGTLSIEHNEVPPAPLENLFPSRLPPPNTSAVKKSSIVGGALTLGAEDKVDRGQSLSDPQQVEPLVLTVDSERIIPTAFTAYKTTRRGIYDEARVRAGIKTPSEPREVLIISEKGNEIMEGSTTTCIFWRAGAWVTPPFSSGGNAGTTRRWLLENGLCQEVVVSSRSLTNGEECWISNGVRGLRWCRIEL